MDFHYKWTRNEKLMANDIFYFLVFSWIKEMHTTWTYNQPDQYEKIDKLFYQWTPTLEQHFNYEVQILLNCELKVSTTAASWLLVLSAHPPHWHWCSLRWRQWPGCCHFGGQWHPNKSLAVWTRTRRPTFDIHKMTKKTLMGL